MCVYFTSKDQLHLGRFFFELSIVNLSDILGQLVNLISSNHRTLVYIDNHMSNNQPFILYDSYICVRFSQEHPLVS